MQCPYCGETRSRVLSSRRTENGAAVRRRRSCQGCDGRFTTYERIEHANRIVKRDGRVEPYCSAKLVASLQAACHKLPVDRSAIEGLERRLLRRVEQESTAGTADLRRWAAMGLRELHLAGCLRYLASGLGDWDLKGMETILDEMMAGLTDVKTSPLTPRGEAADDAPLKSPGNPND